MRNYYAHPDVRARMTEFLGGACLEEATCVYLTTGRDKAVFRNFVPKPPTELDACLNEGVDISRSLWDRASLIADLDIEYVNFDLPAEPYLKPERAFEIQQPVEEAIERILLSYGIAPLHLLSGRGHHFIWRVSRGSRAFEQLAQLGPVPQNLKALYAHPHPPLDEAVPSDLGAAFAGLGLVMEYVAHRIKEVAASACAVPVELTALLVGPREKGREMISIDVSEYGDPLHTRSIRIPFSLYLKPLYQRKFLSDDIADKMPLLFLIPLHEMDVREGIVVMRDVAEVVDLAGYASAQIPDASQSMERLVAAYADAPLARFHDWFYSQEQYPPDTWAHTYDQTPLELLPACARYILEHPNDLLLHPSGIKRLVHILLALGWHPRHIAGLIRSKYEQDYQWGEQWQYGHDPGTRADFYTRLFTGLFVVKHDDLVDFNCQSAIEAQFCFNQDCSSNLEQFRTSLIERRTHERLACRPYNRLFLPNEHP